MRHFAFLDEARRSTLFHRRPEPVGPDSDRLLLATALGATLYAPGTRGDLVAVALRQAALGVTSMVFCLEDAIADDEVAVAEGNVIASLRRLSSVAADQRPMVFVRVRDEAQLNRIVATVRGRSGADRKSVV